MKIIVHIIPRFTTGGAEKLVLQYARLLDAKKFKVHVVSTVDGGELVSAFEKTGIPVFVASRAVHGGRRGAYKALKSYLEDVQPDLIHSHLFGGDLIAWFLSKALSCTWVSTTHNIKAQESLLRRMVWKQIMKRVNKVIAVSAQVDDFIKKSLKIKDAKRTTILNGVEVARWTTVSQTKMFSQKTLKLGTVGRLEKQKGHTHLLDALAALPAEISWTLDIYGDGSLKDSLQHQAQALGIARDIAWHGVVKDMSQHYGSFDIAIQASLWEGLSLVVMEAMAAGRLVLATPVAGGELIEDGENGIIMKKAHSIAIREAIERVFADKKVAKQMAVAARKKAKKQFDLIHNIKAVEALYEELLSD